jgi:hemin uptake protein HemP
MNQIKRDFDTHSAVSEAGVRVVESSDLLQGNREVCIRHGDSLYTLRVTRQGKLILNK